MRISKVESEDLEILRSFAENYMWSRPCKAVKSVNIYLILLWSRQ